MIIEKINIKSFGNLTDFSLEFSTGVNVIEGKNESGKTTIASFIKFMLYGFGDAPEERLRCVNWYSKTAEGSMIVNVEGKRYLITRSTVLAESEDKPAYRDDCSIIDLTTGTPAFGKQAAGEVFFRIDREMFESTAFFGQISDVAYSTGTVKNAIENIIFSASEKINAERASDELTAKMDGLLHENRRGGVIYDMLRQAEALEDRRNAAVENNRLFLEKHTKLNDARKERDEAKSMLEQLTSRNASYRNIVLIESFDRLHEAESEADGAAAAYEAFLAEQSVKSFYPDEQYLADISVAHQKVNDSYITYAKCDAEMERQKSMLGITRDIESDIRLSDSIGGEAQVLSNLKKLRTKISTDLIFAVAGVLLLLAGLIFEITAQGTFAELLPRVIGGFVCLVGIGCVGASLYFYAFRDKSRLTELEKQFDTSSVADLRDKIAVIAEARSKRDTMLRDSEQAKNELAGAREIYSAARDELNRLVLRWCDELPAEEGFGRFLEKHIEKIRAFLSRKNELLAEKNEKELTMREMRRNLNGISEIDVRAQVTPVMRKMLANINPDTLQNGIEEMNSRIRSQESTVAEIEAELNRMTINSVDPGVLQLQKIRIENNISELTRRHKAYFIARQAIEGARENLREEVSPRLAAYATELINVMTDGQYDSFAVSDGLSVSFRGKDGNDHPIDTMSGGTRDLAYVATRAALIDLLYPENPPLCFDETFAHQDNVRARSMMKGIARLTEKEKMQSFIFTCRGREATLASELAPVSGIYKLTASDDSLN